MRDGAPPGMEIAAGEYGTDLFHFARLLAAESVDVVLADVRIEEMLFDGVVASRGGKLIPDADAGRPGLGIELRRADAERWRSA